MIDWRLKDLLERRVIKNSARLQQAMASSLRVDISRQALDLLLQEAPKQLRLETAQYLCSFFQVPLNEFLLITPEPLPKDTGTIIKPYSPNKAWPDAIFTNPDEFLR